MERAERQHVVFEEWDQEKVPSRDLPMDRDKNVAPSVQLELLVLINLVTLYEDDNLSPRRFIGL